MFLKALFLKNFRCYSQASFEFSPGVNVFQGGNAQGKTSIVEAIYFLMTGSSFRASHAQDLIQLDAPFFHLEALFVKHGVEQTLKVTYGNGERQILYNSTPCSSFSGLLGLLPGVVFAPDDVALVKGMPQGRRQFLDLQIAQVNPLYVHHLMRYQKALRQRNVLLRSKNIATLDAWDFEMAQSAAYLTLQRYQTSKDLDIRSQSLYHTLSQERACLNLSYKANHAQHQSEGMQALLESYLALFQRNRKRELLLGFTLGGPQKDDLLIALDKKEARFFASEGQQRSCVAVMRISEWERLRSLVAEPPLLLIDDLGVSLDRNRQELLLNHVLTLGQVFLTTTQEINLPSSPSNKLIHINQKTAC